MDSQRLDLYIAAWGGALPQPGRAFTAACPGMCKNGPRGDSPPLARGRARWSLEGWLRFAWGKCVLSSGAIKELGYESVARPSFFFILTWWKRCSDLKSKQRPTFALASLLKLLQIRKAEWESRCTVRDLPAWRLLGVCSEHPGQNAVLESDQRN